MYRATSLLLHDTVKERSRDFCLWFVIVTEFEGDNLATFEKRMKASVDVNNFEVRWVFIPISKLMIEEL